MFSMAFKDPDGVPLGEWRCDEDAGAWIFDPFVPLIGLPQTGQPVAADVLQRAARVCDAINGPDPTPQEGLPGALARTGGFSR